MIICVAQLTKAVIVQCCITAARWQYKPLDGSKRGIWSLVIVSTVNHWIMSQSISGQPHPNQWCHNWCFNFDSWQKKKLIETSVVTQAVGMYKCTHNPHREQRSSSLVSQVFPVICCCCCERSHAVKWPSTLMMSSGLFEIKSFWL